MKISTDIQIGSISYNIIFDFDKFIFRFMEKTMWGFAIAAEDKLYLREHYSKFFCKEEDISNISYYYHSMIIYTFRTIK